MFAKKVHICVVIINYKTPVLVIDCLESLLPELVSLEVRVVVVDNNSKDDSCENILEWINKNDNLNQVELVTSNKNTGFSGGNNRGISHVDAEYYLLLNSDTVVRKGAISLLLEAAIREDQAGLISPRLEWPDASPQESCFRFHSPVSELIASAGTGLITRLFHTYNVPIEVADKANFYDWASFACVLVKSDVFKDVGLLDEGYFMYFEDVAFAYHAQKVGWEVLNIPEARVIHLRGGSSPVKSQTKLRKRLPRYYYESRTRYFYQLYGYLGLLLANLFRFLGWGISWVRHLMSPTYDFSMKESEWRDIWTNFSNPLGKYIHPDNYDKT